MRDEDEDEVSTYTSRNTYLPHGNPPDFESSTIVSVNTGVHPIEERVPD